MICGSEGMIELFPEHLRLLNGCTGGKWERHEPNGKFFEAQANGFEMFEGHASQAFELADWVEGKSEAFRGEAIHGYKAVEMVSAVHESARLRERVVLPLQTRASPLDLMVESGDLPVRYPGKYDIRAKRLRGENMSSDEDNT